MNVLSVFRFLTNRRLLAQFYAMSRDGWLVDSGWLRSFELRRPVDSEGKPVPWLTSSFLRFLEPRLRHEFRILEYGSGNSTLYYSQRVKSVTSIESDAAWFEELRGSVDSDIVDIYLKQGRQYSQFAATLHRKYDIVVVDGLNRFECAREAISQLSESGVIVLDNSVRSEYKPIYKMLVEEGFRFIDFFGMAPGSRKYNSTTVFYRSDNCLNL